MKKIILLAVILSLSGCAINFCNKNQDPKQSKCRPWDPGTTTGSSARG